MTRGVYIARGRGVQGRGMRGRGVHSGGHAWQGRCPWRGAGGGVVLGETATAADGTHPSQASVILSTISLMPTRSLFILVGNSVTCYSAVGTHHTGILSFFSFFKL